MSCNAIRGQLQRWTCLDGILLVEVGQQRRDPLTVVGHGKQLRREIATELSVNSSLMRERTSSDRVLGSIRFRNYLRREVRQHHRLRRLATRIFDVRTTQNHAKMTAKMKLETAGNQGV